MHGVVEHVEHRLVVVCLSRFVYVCCWLKITASRQRTVDSRHMQRARGRECQREDEEPWLQWLACVRRAVWLWHLGVLWLYMQVQMVKGT
jgi:hypothetical protein